LILSHIDLFSGIGGFSLACQWNGIETEVFCERDKFCQRVLKRHWPNVPIVSDIAEFDGSAYSGAFILTGGFPCQPFSCAGKQRGKEDDRWLWPEMLKVITAARPRWVLAENVPGIVKMELDTVLSDLEAEGYATGTLIIPACAVNAPHRRDRVWIVANTNGGRWNSQSLSGTECLGGKNHVDIEQSGQDVADSERSGCNGKEISVPRRGSYQKSVDSTGSGMDVYSRRRGIDTISDRDLESRLGMPSDRFPRWMVGAWGTGEWEDGIPRVATGIKDRVNRLRALGNAIVPQVAYEIIKTILQVEAQKS
jgi:DNA (cytosine-5)-methyltransferase 1